MFSFLVHGLLAVELEAVEGSGPHRGGPFLLSQAARA